MNIIVTITHKLKRDSFLSDYPQDFKYAFLAFMAVMNTGGLVWGLLALYFEFYYISIIPFFYILFSMLNLSYLLYSENFRIVRFLQVINSILLPFVFQWLLGGFSATGVVMLWSFLALVALLTFYKTTEVWLWLAFFVSLVIISAYTDGYSLAIAPQSLLNLTVQRILFCINVGMIGIMMFVLVRYFISVNRSEQKISALLLEQKDALLKKNLEINEINEEIQSFSEDMLQQNEEILSINEELEIQKKFISAKNEDLVDSIYYAKRIQNAILGDYKELNKQFNDIFILFHPRDVVSGDFFWHAHLNLHAGLHAPINDRSKRPSNFIPGSSSEITLKQNFVKLLVTGDCTGHGVPAAFMTLLGLNLLEEIVHNKRLTNPAEILFQLDEELSQKLNSAEKINENEQVNDGMDISLISIDEANKKIIISSAKSSVFFVHNQNPVTIKGSIFSIGGHRFDTPKVFENQEFQYTRRRHGLFIYGWLPGSVWRTL